jgi:hypothetical protein
LISIFDAPFGCTAAQTHRRAGLQPCVNIDFVAFLTVFGWLSALFFRQNPPRCIVNNFYGKVNMQNDIFVDIDTFCCRRSTRMNVITSTRQVAAHDKALSHKKPRR